MFKYSFSLPKAVSALCILILLNSLLLPGCGSETKEETVSTQKTEIQEPEAQETVSSPVLITRDTTNITTGSATIHGEVKNLEGSSPVTISFELGIQSGFFPSQTPEYSLEQSGDFSYDLSSLYAYMTYYYRIKMTSGTEITYGEEKSFTTLPEMILQTGVSYSATIKTNHGDIEIQLLPDDAPLAVNNFICLSRQGYYNGITFHRVVKDFMIQSGDPTGTGGGDPGYKFIDEEISREYLPGIVAMANRGPNTNGSQFFICLTDLRTRLAKSYTIFGLVTNGMDVVEEIGNVPVTANAGGEVSKPVDDVLVEEIIINED